MSNTYKLKSTRALKQGVTPSLMSTTAMPLMTAVAYNSMVLSPWEKTTEKLTTLPKHYYAQSGFRDTYDAAKFCGDYSESQQNAYACAVCYTIKIPLDALVATIAKIESISATLYGDRWLSEGAILSAIPSSSAEPPEWDSVLAASYTSPNPAEAVDAVSDWVAPLRQIVRSNSGADNKCDAVLELGDTGVDAMRYLHIVLRLSDYISVPQLVNADLTTRDSAWIEGGALIDGATISVTFDRVVADDPGIVLTTIKKPITVETPRNLNFDQFDVQANFSHEGTLTIFESVGGVMNLISEGVGLDDYHQTGPENTFGLKSLTTGTLSCSLGIPNSACFIMRGLMTYGGYAKGLSFSNPFPKGLSAETSYFPVGIKLRIAMYMHSGTIPPVSFTASASEMNIDHANCLSSSSAFSQELRLGSASSIGLTRVTAGAWAFDDTLTAITVGLTPLGTYDISDSSMLPAGTMIPFSSNLLLPRYAIFFVVISVIGVTADYAPLVDPFSGYAQAELDLPDFNIHLIS